VKLRTMTFRTESRIAIARTMPQVWAYVCDVSRWQEWAPTVIECRIRGGGALQPGSRLDQRAQGILGTSRSRSQEVTAVEEPRRVAFAGPLGTSTARWGMELEPLGDGQTDTLMWIEVDLAGPMRALPRGLLKGRIQRVSDLEMTLIKGAVESGSAP
jgi:Polyketide cyclase / dehydrase and lipid transport